MKTSFIGALNARRPSPVSRFVPASASTSCFSIDGLRFIRIHAYPLETSRNLIVIGRNEKTESLEAQVRGSRHAWDIRLISVESLMRLVTVKEDLETPQAVQKIRQILRPKEYTKVDEIIDLVFSAATDAKAEEKLQLEIEPLENGEKKSAPVNFREACIARIQQNLNLVL